MICVYVGSNKSCRVPVMRTFSFCQINSEGYVKVADNIDNYKQLCTKYAKFKVFNVVSAAQDVLIY